jgi:hypothetical protein
MTCKKGAAGATATTPLSHREVVGAAGASRRGDVVAGMSRFDGTGVLANVCRALS